MKKILRIIFVFLIIISCNQTEQEIQKIHLNYKVVRFDSLFFSMDTIEIASSMEKLSNQYPLFTSYYLYYILQFDTSFQTTQIQNKAIKNFIRIYKPLYDSSRKKLGNLSLEKIQLYKGFQHLKYYFPQFITPNVYTYIASFNGLGVAIFPKDILGIGLQMFLGKDFSYYKHTGFSSIFPTYISKRFSSEYMVRMCIDQELRDLYPIESEHFSFIEQIIVQGRYWYVLKKLLPNISDTIITQYSKEQLIWCQSNETELWKYILAQNKNMYTKDPEIIRMYLGEAPFTQNIGQHSPGNIGSWVGLQIVSSYMKNHTMSLQELMEKKPAHIFQQSKYFY
ncbi:MAG: hypothetical protein ACRCR9_02660 [Chitinophagaceae bacterium]